MNTCLPITKYAEEKYDEEKVEKIPYVEPEEGPENELLSKIDDLEQELDEMDPRDDNYDDLLKKVQMLRDTLMVTLNDGKQIEIVDPTEIEETYRGKDDWDEPGDNWIEEKSELGSKWPGPVGEDYEDVETDSEPTPKSPYLNPYASVIPKLVKIANDLDAKGLYKEADELDQITKSI